MRNQAIEDSNDQSTTLVAFDEVGLNKMTQNSSSVAEHYPLLMTSDENQALSYQLGIQESRDSINMADSRGIVKNIDYLTSDVVEEDECFSQGQSGPQRAEEDCESDSESPTENDARKVFSTRSIKDLSLSNFQRFKTLNQESQLRGHFQSERVAGLQHQQ